MKFWRSIILFAGLLLSCSFSSGQSARDTSFILQLLNKSESLRDSLPEQSLQIVNDALQKSISSGFKKGEAIAYARLGRWYFGNDINKSTDYANKAINIFESGITAPEEKADMHLLLAEAYDEQGKTDSSAYYYYQLGTEMESGGITKPEFKMQVYTKLVIFWINLNAGNNNDEKIKQTILGYVEKAKSAAQFTKNRDDGISGIYFIQGIYYHGINSFDSARFYYQKFLDTKKNMSVPRRISTLTNLADTYLQENKPEKAMPYIKEVYAMDKDSSTKKFLSFFMGYTGLMEGRALIQMKNFRGAVEVLERSLKLVNASGGHLRDEVVNAYNDIGTAYEEIGDHANAVKNKDLYIKYYDSLSKKEKSDMIGRLEIRNRIAEKDKELVQRELTIAQVNEKVRNRNSLIAAIIVALLFLGLILFMWRRRNLHKQKLQQRNIENLQQKIKIERLNATIAGEEKERTRIARELHDGVAGLITAAKMNFELAKNKTSSEPQSDFNQGMKMLEDAGIELRQAARNLMPEVLLQEGLVKALQLFCERITEKSNVQINFQSMGDKKITDNNLELSIYRIIQELVHNIVKHSRANNALVQLSFQDDGGMTITVEDDGVGMNKTSITHGAGMGMKNIRDRVTETGGKLDIQSEEGKGTSVYIEYESQI